MPPTTGYSFGDVVLVPFPFTDQSGSKKRPAVIVNSADYQAQRRDLVIMVITSQIRARPAFAGFTVAACKKAGLIPRYLDHQAAIGIRAFERSSVQCAGPLCSFALDQSSPSIRTARHTCARMADPHRRPRRRRNQRSRMHGVTETTGG